MPKVSFGGAEWTMMSPLEIESTGGGEISYFEWSELQGLSR